MCRLDCHAKQHSTTSCMCAVILRSLPPLLSPLSSSPVLLNMGVGSAVLEVGVAVPEVGVGILDAHPAPLVATTLMV